MRLSEKLEFVTSVQNPTSEDISFFISILTDPNENELLQTAALLALKRGGDAAVLSLTALLDSETHQPRLNSETHQSRLDSETQKLRLDPYKNIDPAAKIRITYALSQIPETPASVLIGFLSDADPRVRQNAAAGLALQNDGEFDLLLFSVLQNDPDLKTAYEAAEALEAGGERTLYLFKSVILRDLKQNPYINSDKRIEAVNKIQHNDTVSEKPGEDCPDFPARMTDDHLLWKILNVLGNTKNPDVWLYIEPYLFHENPKIRNLAETIDSELSKRPKPP
ncbi:MAG: HEAT repeat domain-containing protein [Methanimicrococcus sp.]|nr:HEAT repeat domain-containing protein [Methanimicrococcus sp.]